VNEWRILNSCTDVWLAYISYNRYVISLFVVLSFSKLSPSPLMIQFFINEAIVFSPPYNRGQHFLFTEYHHPLKITRIMGDGCRYDR